MKSADARPTTERAAAVVKSFILKLVFVEVVFEGYV